MIKIQIKSQFKDYYDHVAHKFGGGDPSITYLRNRLTPLRHSYGTTFVDEIVVVQDGLMPLPYIDYGSCMDFKWLSVVGKRYLLVRTHTNYTLYTDWKIFTEKDHPELWQKMNISRGRFSRINSTSLDYVGVFSDSLVELSRKVRAPVFTFRCNRSNNAMVDGNIPILGDLGMAKLISPEQLYQELSYFIGNVMKESPDMMPPTKMTDKEKITQHGFDNRISFRHRV